MTIDLNLSHKVARAYLDAPISLPSADVRTIYARFNAEVHDQFNLIQSTGLRLIPSAFPLEASYLMADDIARDVLHRNQLIVFTGANPEHGLMNARQNFEFRVVHDIFGHVLANASLGHYGEERAYRAHKRMFSHEAGIALATETRGQNCAYHFSADVETFHVQKAIILPEDLRK